MESNNRSGRRCLYCGNNVGLWQSLFTRNRFCCDRHREAFFAGASLDEFPPPEEENLEVCEQSVALVEEPDVVVDETQLARLFG